MVIGIFKIEETRKVKNNPYYGDYEVKSEFTKTITNQYYKGLITPQKGIVIKVTNIDGEKLTITIGKYSFTGLTPEEFESDSTFTHTFTHGGHVYEVEVDREGKLVHFFEWYNYDDFEDDIHPDNIYRTRSKGIKWELIDM